MAKVLTEFKDLYAVFTIRTYDCLDPEENGFIEGLLESDDGKKAVVMCGHEVNSFNSLIVWRNLYCVQ